MRVGLLIYGLDRPFSGIGRYTVALTKALDGIARQRWAASRPDLVLLTAGRAPQLAKVSGSSVSLPGCRLLPGLMTVGNVLIPLQARRLGLDVVHDLTGVTPFLLTASAAVRTVVTVYDVFAWSCPGHSTWLDTLIYRYWLPRVLPRVDAVITVSQVSKADIVRYLNIAPAKIHVAYPGVDARFHPLPEAEVARVRRRYGLPDRYILFVGSVEKRKNLVGLLRAYAHLLSSGAGAAARLVPLVIVGARRRAYTQMPGAQEIEATLQSLALEHKVARAAKVMFTGFVPDADLPALYNGAVLFVFPSLYEGFGFPPLEAMACGTPVVCSNTASLPEVVGALGASAALMVDPHDIEGLADAMRRVIEDKALRQALRQRGLARAQRFTWARTARQVLAVYQGLSVASEAIGASAASDTPAATVQRRVGSQEL